MSLIPYPHEVKYTDEKGQSLLRNTSKTRRLTTSHAEKIQDFLSKFEGIGDDIMQGLEAMDIQDKESHRRNKYTEQLVGRRPYKRAPTTDELPAQLRIANREQEKLVIDLEDIAKVRFC